MDKVGAGPQLKEDRATDPFEVRKTEDAGRVARCYGAARLQRDIAKRAVAAEGAAVDLERAGYGSRDKERTSSRSGDRPEESGVGAVARGERAGRAQQDVAGAGDGRERLGAVVHVEGAIHGERRVIANLVAACPGEVQGGAAGNGGVRAEGMDGGGAILGGDEGAAGDRDAEPDIVRRAAEGEGAVAHLGERAARGRQNHPTEGGVGVVRSDAEEACLGAHGQADLDCAGTFESAEGVRKDLGVQGRPGGDVHRAGGRGDVVTGKCERALGDGGETAVGVGDQPTDLAGADFGGVEDAAAVMERVINGEGEVCPENERAGPRGGNNVSSTAVKRNALATAIEIEETAGLDDDLGRIENLVSAGASKAEGGTGEDGLRVAAEGMNTGGAVFGQEHRAHFDACESTCIIFRAAEDEGPVTELHDDFGDGRVDIQRVSGGHVEDDGLARQTESQQKCKKRGALFEESITSSLPREARSVN